MTFNIESIEYEVGEVELDLSKIIPDFSRTFDKTGISKVYLTKGPVHEMGVKAAKKALNSCGRNRKSIKFLIYVTQSPSKVLPGDSILVHKKLELSPGVALYDINAGCSGFVQALFLGVQLVKVLGPGMIVCSDAYREKLDPNDRSTNAVFSDAGSAVIISPDGKLELSEYSFEVESAKGPEYLVQEHMGVHLKMNGPALWEYTRSSVVRQINDLITKGRSLGIQTERLYIHQASKLVVDGISFKIQLNKVIIPKNYSLYGNSVSSTLPILMRDDIDTIKRSVSLLAGFGVGIMSVCLLIKGGE